MFGVAEDHDSNPIKIGLGKLKGRAAPSSFRSTRSAPVIRRSPTNGSASGPAPTGCSSWRSSTSCCGPTRSISISSSATPTRLAGRPEPGAADDGLFARDVAGHPLCWDADDRRIDAATAGRLAGMAGEVTLARRRRARSGVPAPRRALPRSALLARRVGGGTRHPRRQPSGASPRSSPMPRSSSSRIERPGPIGRDAGTTG